MANASGGWSADITEKMQGSKGAELEKKGLDDMDDSWKLAYYDLLAENAKLRRALTDERNRVTALEAQVARLRGEIGELRPKVINTNTEIKTVRRRRQKPAEPAEPAEAAKVREGAEVMTWFGGDGPVGLYDTGDVAKRDKELAAALEKLRRAGGDDEDN